MNRNRFMFLLTLLSAFFSLTLTGCGAAGGSAQAIIFEAEYGSASNPQGMSLADPSGVTLQLNPAQGNTCTSFYGASGATAVPNNAANTPVGQYNYVPPCDPLYIAVSRSPSSYCGYTNLTGGYQNWLYNAEQYYSGSTVYHLPCGVAAPNLVITPVAFYVSTYVTLSMTGSPGDFDPSQGTPLATYYDQYGSLLGQMPVQSTSPDGSTVVFPSDPITNDSSLIGNFFVAVLNTAGDSWEAGGGAGTVLVLSSYNGGGGGGGGDDCTDACATV